MANGGVWGGGGGLNPKKQLPKNRHFDFFPWKVKAPKSKTIWNLEFGVFSRTVTWPSTCFKLFLSSFHFNSLIQREVNSKRYQRYITKKITLDVKK